ncbi:hypothetical protein L2E82_38913 [Cichorium intybus]|uniref:Uncharacterized protein n=1 Tax=Cichorium intybus TaxID=13427 RepID=A0ACB9AG03_CICIN|nr:hypothetical protein L2E82_38913 [Cichorium intybus]
MTLQANSSMAPSSPVDAKPSPWQSPVPYLFGGLAAMFVLLAFALLVVVYSYWKLSSSSDNGVGVEDGDVENGNGGGNSKAKNSIDYQLHPVAKEKYLVIMAGETKPTFLAAPVCGIVS